MKRNSTKYTNVVGGDIYKHYGLLFWQECFFCNKEFRREAGYGFAVIMYFLFCYFMIFKTRL